jgi:hypothetical protein
MLMLMLVLVLVIIGRNTFTLPHHHIITPCILTVHQAGGNNMRRTVLKTKTQYLNNNCSVKTKAKKMPFSTFLQLEILLS